MISGWTEGPDNQGCTVLLCVACAVCVIIQELQSPLEGTNYGSYFPYIPEGTNYDLSTCLYCESIGGGIYYSIWRGS